MDYTYICRYIYLCERWVWVFMWLRRLRCTTACDFLRRRCGRCHHVRMRVYIRRNILPTHTSCTYMYVYIYIYIDAKSGYVTGYARVFLHTRAIACGR